MASVPAHAMTECFEASLVSSTSIFNGGSPLDYSFPLLALQLLVIVSTSWILYFLLRPLKQPRVVSEILGGILLGPSGLGRISGFKNFIFPDKHNHLLGMTATFGLMFVTFNIGVKMDPSLIRRSRAKSVTIGLLGMAIPFTVTILLGEIHLFPPSISKNPSTVQVLATCLSGTSFAVLIPILVELNLLNSELGRTATSASFTNDAVAWFLSLSYAVIMAAKASASAALYALFAMAACLPFLFLVVRPIAHRAIANTLPGKPVNEDYIFIFLLFLLITGFISDAIGIPPSNGALLLGFAIPDGPPLGSTLSKRTEAFVSGLFSPLYYALIGRYADTTSIVEWHGLALIILGILVVKLVSIILPSLYFRMPIRDAISLSLFMGSNGLINIIAYQYLRAGRIIDDQEYTVLILSSVAITALVIPIATMLYQPSKRYAVYKRRTVEHHKPDTELRIVACVHDEARVPAIISFLEASTAAGLPVAIYALHLVELVGRTAPLFISSGDHRHHPRVQDSERINNAFQMLEQRQPAGSPVSVHSFTTICPYGSMHDEICRMAAEKRAALVVLPFHKTPAVSGIGWEQYCGNNGLRAVNLRVLDNAPCSVGVLVDGSNKTVVRSLSSGFSQDVAVLFFGGADDREALALAGMMAAHPGVRVTLLRLLPRRSIRDDQLVERKLDTRAVEEFRARNIWNERVGFREKLVGDMEEVVAAIRETERRGFDLVMVGMRHVSKTVVSELSAEWADCPELGVIGDILAYSSEFQSVLVVKQQAGVMGPHQQQHHHHHNDTTAEEKLPPAVIAGSTGALRAECGAVAPQLRHYPGWQCSNPKGAVLTFTL